MLIVDHHVKKMYILEFPVRSNKSRYSGAPTRAKRAWDRTPYSQNMVNLFSFGFHVNRTYASTDCMGRVGETIKRKGGVSQACLGKSTSLI